MTFLAYPETEQQKKILALTSDLADTFAERAAKHDWEGSFPYENFADLHKAGYLTLTVPRELGGWGAPLVDVMLAQERLAQGDASTALITSMHLSHVARFAEVLAGQSSDFFTPICQAIVQDGALVNVAATEPGTGSPSRGGRPQTTARRQPDGSWRISGRKTFTTGSPVLHFFIVSCAIEDESGLEAITAPKGSFVVVRGTPGMHVKETWNTVGMRESGSHDLLLEDVQVGPEAYVEAYVPSDTMGQARQSAWSFLTVVVYLGIAQGARNFAVQFAKNRRPSSLNQPISTIPHIQEKVAKMDLALLQSKAVLYSVAEQYTADSNSVQPAQFAAAKYLVTNHAAEVTDLAMRLVGGASLSLNFPVQRYYRDVRAGFNHPPMDDVTLSMLAKQAFEL
jgi:alkylation response protein AidB-like acyl-CoA dehydrogenase